MEIDFLGPKREGEECDVANALRKMSKHGLPHLHKYLLDVVVSDEELKF